MESRYRDIDIDRHLESGPAKNLQWLVNHEELYFYASFDIEMQREFGERLKKHWEQKLPEECPDIPAYVDVKDDGISVILTVRNESFRSE